MNWETMARCPVVSPSNKAGSAPSALGLAAADCDRLRLRAGVALRAPPRGGVGKRGSAAAHSATSRSKASIPAA
eukprot:7933190-Alexandrium_andersonii.AAC.1